MSLSIITAVIYGILSIVGGIIGYKQAGSKASIISGGISGFLLIFAALIQFLGQSWGFYLAVCLTTALVFFFAFRLFKTRKFMPAGLMTFLGIISLILMNIKIN
jgi:uncharacterized membrane protein (UPF0136 family)